MEKNKFDLVILSIIAILILCYTFLIQLIYPYSILDWDTISWYEYAKYFSLSELSKFEDYRRLPFGLLLIFATKFSMPAKAIIYLNTFTFYLSVISLYYLSKDLVLNTLLRIIFIFVLLLLTFVLHKLSFLNFWMLAEASTSAFFVIGAVFSLRGFFLKKKSFLIVGFLILGIGAYSKGNTIAIIPAWIYFLYNIRKEFNKIIIITCLILLLGPTFLHELRLFMLNGTKFSYGTSEYLLARVMPLAKNDLVILDNPESNAKALSILREFEDLHNPTGYDDYLSMRFYISEKYGAWHTVLAESINPRNCSDPNFCFKAAVRKLLIKILKNHPWEYIKLVYERYLLVFYTLFDCGFALKEDINLRYLHLTHSEENFSYSKELFYKDNYNFKILNPHTELVNKLKSFCEYLPVYNLTVSRLVLFCAHFLLLILLFIPNISFPNTFLNNNNCLLVYKQFLLSSFCLILLNTIMHFTHSRHVVTSELFLNYSFFIFLLLIISFISMPFYKISK